MPTGAPAGPVGMLDGFLTSVCNEPWCDGLVAASYLDGCWSGWFAPSLCCNYLWWNGVDGDQKPACKENNIRGDDSLLPTLWEALLPPANDDSCARPLHVQHM